MPFVLIQPRGFRSYVSTLAFLLAALMGCYLVGCTKPDDEITPRVDSPLTPMGPSGNIKEFTVQDSLIGYGRQTIIKWNVTETNTRTVVTLNGVKVALYGGIQSGPLYGNSNFTLAVNSGKTATKAIIVADALTTNLWNDGQRWMPADVLRDTVKVYKNIQNQDSAVHEYISIFDRSADKYRNERLSFFLDRNSKEEQLSTSYPKPNPSGMFVPIVQNGGSYLIWKNRIYIIDSLSDRMLSMTFDTTQNTGVSVRTRIQFKPEY